MVELPTGYALRSPGERDAGAIADVVQARAFADESALLWQRLPGQL